MSNLVTTVEFVGNYLDVISVNGSKVQNQKRVERLEAAIQELVNNFERGIWDGGSRVTLSIAYEERGDFGY